MAETPPTIIDVADATGERLSPANALTAALAQAHAEFPTIAKNQTAEVRGKDGKPGYSYSYADLGDVLAAVRPVLAKHGLVVIQRTHHDEKGKVILTTKLRHVAGGEEDSIVELGQAPGNPQAFGGALTYLRRYELTTLLGIAAEEDRDAQDVPNTPRNGAAQAPAELPYWARAASDERKAQYVEALAPIIGPARAKALGGSVSQSIGHLPDAIVGFAKALAVNINEELGEAVATRARQRGAEARARAQDQAAEAPDTPTPEEPAPASTDEGYEERVADAETAAQEPTTDTEAPLPGTVDPPAIPEDLNRDDVAQTDALEAEFRKLGCICGNPLAPDDATGAHEDACPIAGHGIPF